MPSNTSVFWTRKRINALAVILDEDDEEEEEDKDIFLPSKLQLILGGGIPVALQ